MANTGFMCSSSTAVQATTAATSQFWSVGGMLAISNTETDVQTVCRDAGTFHDLFVRITANSATGTNTFTFRNNAAAGNQTVNPAGATGTFHDTTHTDAVVATDKFNYNSSADSTLTTSYTLLAILFDSTTNFSTRHCCTRSAGTTYTTGSSNSNINGRLQTNSSTESAIKTQITQAGTMQFLQTNINGNAKTANMTNISRIGTPTIANGNMTVTLTASTNGIFEDSTNSDTIAANNTWDTSKINGTDTTHSVNWLQNSVDFITSTGNFFLIAASSDADVAGTASSTLFTPLGGQISFLATESTVQSNALAAFTYSNLIANQSVASTATGTIHFRKNAGNGNQVVTFGTATGIYTDSTHSDAVISTDAVNTSFTFGATTAGSFRNVSCMGNFATSGIPLYLQPLFMEWVES